MKNSSSGLLLWVCSTLLAAAAAFVFFGSVAAFGHPPFNDSEGGPSNPWESFHNLSGCHLGDYRPGLADVKKYLSRFGYLPDQSSNFSDAFDDALEAALLAYQRNFHLNSSGALDIPTVDLMVMPRCGVADVINGTTVMHGRGLYSYFSGRPTWPSSRRDLTYAFVSTSAVSIDISAIRAVFFRAFSRWSAVTTLTFSKAAFPPAADITIGFYSGDHGNEEPFDGVLGTLAHAFSPTNGRLHLDAAENWVAEADVTAALGAAAAVDLESVVVHEIGHLLGLGHSNVEEAIMYPTIRARTKKVELAKDDVDGIQNLYGSNPSYTGPAGTSPPATTTGTTTMRESDNNGGKASSPGPAGWARVLGGVLVAVGVPLLVW